MSENAHLSGIGVDDSPKPVLIHERKTFLTASYNARLMRGEHSRADMDAVVTYNGEPITAGGEVLRLGMIPAERRYAVGPVSGGRAEVLDQRDFQDAHLDAYLTLFSIVKQPPDDPNLRHIPSVVDFVSCKLDSHDPKKIVPLGSGMAAKGERTTYWSEAKQEVVDVADVRDEQQERIRELEERLAKLGGTDEAPAAAPVAEEASMEAAPCGKLVKRGFVNQHVRFCKSDECNPQPEAAA